MMHRRQREARAVPVVLLDLNLQSLALARALGRRGIPVRALVWEAPRFEHRTRYAEIVRIAGGGPAHLLAELASIASQPGPAPLLLPTTDDTVLFLSAHRHLLSRDFRLLMPSHELLEALVSKDGMSRLAAGAGVPQPGCWHPGSAAELADCVAEMRFPVLLKPRHAPDWERPELRALVGGKVARCADESELKTTWTALRDLDSDVVVQEEIEGSSSRLVYYVGLYDAESRPLASFSGTKLRTLPAHYGSASAVVAERNDEVIATSERFMRSIGYRGHVGIEYKIDPRDGTPKLIEVNARWGLWDGLAARCGIDFADLSYRYQTGAEIEKPTCFEEGRRWVSFDRDLWAVGDYCREGAITRGRWLRELATIPTEWSVWALDDPMPFAGAFRDLSAAVARVALQKAARGVGLSRPPRTLAAGVPAPARR